MTTVPGVDLTTAFGPVRDQGARPTCIAFATSDIHAAARSPYAPLSVEYLYYHACRRGHTFDPHNGVTAAQVTDALRQNGQPAEYEWPYLVDLPPNIQSYVPPTPIQDLFRAEAAVTGVDPAALRAALDATRPLALILWLTPAFFRPAVGARVDDGAGANRVGLHAVVVVGYSIQGGNISYRIRNSWGPGWADGGYAWLSDSYLLAHGVLKLEIM